MTGWGLQRQRLEAEQPFEPFLSRAGKLLRLHALRPHRTRQVARPLRSQQPVCKTDACFRPAPALSNTGYAHLTSAEDFGLPHNFPLFSDTHQLTGPFLFCFEENVGILRTASEATAYG